MNMLKIFTIFVISVSSSLIVSSNEKAELGLKIKNYESIASKIDLPKQKNAHEGKDLLRLVLIKWDMEVSNYKAILCYSIPNGDFKYKYVFSDACIELNGKIDNNNFVCINLRYFKTDGKNISNVYTINTSIILGNRYLNLLGWSNQVSRFNPTPEFICFIKRGE